MTGPKYGGTEDIGLYPPADPEMREMWYCTVIRILSLNTRHQEDLANAIHQADKVVERARSLRVFDGPAKRRAGTRRASGDVKSDLG